jgi:phospholipid-transporting ATPase
MANVYFLFIMVLQIIPQISITGGQPAILLPLLFVVAVSAIKDLFEDIKRHRADAQENNRKALVADPKTGEFT